MGALGAEVILVDRLEHSRHGHISGDDLALVEAAARRVTDERSAFRADQFRLPGDANAHESGTGPEMWSSPGAPSKSSVSLWGPVAPSPASPDI